jgi:DnaJ family protein C protein 9
LLVLTILVQKVSKRDISDFSKEYRGSDEEKKDVLEAYTTYKGNLRKVLEVVMVSRDEDLGRFATYCQQAIDAGT